MEETKRGWRFKTFRIARKRAEIKLANNIESLIYYHVRGMAIGWLQERYFWNLENDPNLPILGNLCDYVSIDHFSVNSVNSNTVTNFLLVNSVNLSCRVMEILIIEEEEKKKKTTNPFYQII